MYNPVLSDENKRDNEMTGAHRKQIIQLLKNRKLLFSHLSTIWYIKYCCADQYRCETALYLISMLLHAFHIIIDWGVVSLGHGGQVF